MISIANNFSKVRKIIHASCKAHHRPENAVQLLAVSKTRSAQQLVVLHQAGQLHFGENYLQEALDKQALLAKLPLIWHFIGPIQSNKTRAIAENFSWVHSVDRFKIAKRLSEQRPSHLPPINICLQVNISNEANKAGCSALECTGLLAQMSSLEHIKVRGLMAIPKATDNILEQRAAFSDMSHLLTQCRLQYPQLDTLSMGMSADMDPAIGQGATIIRVGTALFGPRDYSNKA
jgi:pyridoxal phosphate enzyme (YggS family)